MLRIRKSRQRKDTIAWTLVLVFLVVGAGAGAWFVKRALPEPLDPRTNCPLSGPVARTAIVLDATDVLDTVSANHLRLQLEAFLNESVRVGEGVQIWRVSSERERNHADTAIICKPPVTTSALTNNPKREAQRHQKRYLDPLVEAIDVALAVPPGERSPILETLQDVQLSFPSAPDARELKKRIVLASDLVQNTATLSLVFGNHDFARFRSSRAYIALAPGDLTGVEVLVWQIARQRQFGRESTLRAFWRALIETHHGRFAVHNVMGQS